MRNVKITSTDTFIYEREQPTNPAGHRGPAMGIRTHDKTGGRGTSARHSRCPSGTESPITISIAIQEPTGHLCGHSESGNCGGCNCAPHEFRHRHQPHTNGGGHHVHAACQCHDTDTTKGSREVYGLWANTAHVPRRAAMPPLPTTVRFIGNTLSHQWEGE